MNLDPCRIPDDLKDQTHDPTRPKLAICARSIDYILAYLHGDCETPCPVEDPESKLRRQEHGEEDCEEKIAAVRWDVV